MLKSEVRVIVISQLTSMSTPPGIRKYPGNGFSFLQVTKYEEKLLHFDLKEQRDFS